jgi:hypothetical protein
MKEYWVFKRNHYSSIPIFQDLFGHVGSRMSVRIILIYQARFILDTNDTIEKITSHRAGCQQANSDFIVRSFLTKHTIMIDFTAQ